MKNKIHIKFSLWFLAVFMLFTSCDILDVELDDRLTMDMVFDNRQTVERFLNHVYSYTPQEWIHDQTPWVPASDEADFIYRRGYHNINSGNWDPGSAPFHKWSHYYQGIRNASYFMERVPECEELSPAQITTMIAEARFLRAYFYFQLIRQYGPVIILGEESYPLDGSVHMARSSFDESVQWVSEEFSKAAANLPLEWPTQWYGKATKGAALAYRSRLLLYAASPLYNGNSMYTNARNSDGSPLFSASYNEDKWRQAAMAAREVIDLNQYQLVNRNNDPFTSYWSVFTESWNEEIIHGRSEGGWWWDMHCRPRGRQGYGGKAASQLQIDAYAMNNGIYPITGYNGSQANPVIDPASGYNDTGFTVFTHPIEGQTRETYNMFVNREPRFYVSLLWSGANWIFPGAEYIVRYHWGGADGPAASAHDYPKSGVSIRKMSHPSNDFTTPVVTRSWIMFRYAEILLNYVEALNEYDPSNPDIVSYLNIVRNRAGVPDIQQVYPQAVGNKELMREMIRRERRVELAFETHRFFDTRRWLIGEETNGQPFYGMNIFENTDAPGSDFWQRHHHEDRIFEPKHYLYPIPQSELERNNLLVQNPLW